ncbi:hypothetical protein CRYUN_Cryun12cG0103500 [Craigia yunnanensis]
MRSDVKSYKLSGMGCSAGAIGIDLAQNLLKTNKNSYAIVLSTEILSAGWYPGHERSMLPLNCLFRMGSAAFLLTNKKEASKSSKYRLLHALRTQTAFEDEAYLMVIREEDASGKLGVTFDKNLLQAAGEILRFGNRSSSSKWYVLAYMEAKERVKKGDKVLLLGMGTGPKCSSSVWECVRPIVRESKKNPWRDCIHLYPIDAVSSNSPT